VSPRSAQVLGGKLAYGFKQPEASAETAGVDGDHRPCDQVAEKRAGVLVVRDRFHSAEAEGCGEDGQDVGTTSFHPV
jgi:hypothetical protein